jgi:hypothetical protein
MTASTELSITLAISICSLQDNSGANEQNSCQHSRYEEVHMSRVLLLDTDDTHAECVRIGLGFNGLHVEVFSDPEQAAKRLRMPGTDYEIVILNVSNVSLPWDDILAGLETACFQSGAFPSPLFLCVSRTKRSPEFELRVERMGARYVYER